MTVQSKAPARVLLCISLSLLVGCTDSSLATVQGRLVTHTGESLMGAKVIARSMSTGIAVRGGTDANGHFELHSEETGARIPPGEYEVIVVEELGPLDAQRSPSISHRYRNAASSGLTLSLAPGEDKDVNWTLDGP